MKICTIFTGEQQCLSAISIKLQSNLVEVPLLHGCSTVNFLHIFRAPFYKNTYGGLLLEAMAWSHFIKTNCIETNKIFLVSRIYIWATKAFSRVCNATYYIATARKMLLVPPEPNVKEKKHLLTYSRNVLYYLMKLQGSSLEV